MNIIKHPKARGFQIHLAPGARMPTYATAEAAGMDLHALKPVTIPSRGWRLVETGVSIALPAGYEAQIRPRSGLAARYGVTVLNAPGTIDSDYRGEIKVCLINHSPNAFVVRKGDRIAQMVFAPVVRAKWVQVDSLDETERGAGGFGSTGR